MEFPVDLLATVEPEALEQSAKDYMSKLLYRNPEDCESLSLPDSSEVEIGLCNVSFVPLYGGDSKQKVLALFSPEDRFKAIGLYLLGQWWSAEDILKTADRSRTGLLKVRTTGERIVLYVLNKIIYRTKEKASDDVHFLCHEEQETAKILWKDGEAIGFYSVKTEGTLCSNFLTQCYQLPIMDTIFIRKCHRGKGYGLQMLEDFIRTFRKDSLGLKYPLTPAMYKVCKNYLSTYPADRGLLWEVEGIGGPFQRTLIARKLQTMELKGDHKVVSRLNFETESTNVPVEKITTQEQKTMEYTVEVVEEVVQIKITKEVQDTPVTTRGRSSNLKRRKLGEDTEATTEKIIRVEDIEAGVQCPVDESMSEAVRSSLDVTASNLKETTVSVTHGEANVLDVTPVHFKEHKEMTAESEECVLEVCASTKPTAEPATVTPEDALEKTDLLQTTPFAEIQSMNSSEETQVVKSFEATIGSVDLQPLELQQVVGVEVVKMTSGTEELKEKTIEVTGTKDEVEEDKASSEEITSLQKPSQQTELDLKAVSMITEDSTVTEVRVLRKSSKVSSATSQRKCTCIHKELQEASTDDKAAPKHRTTQSIEAVQQSTQVVDQPENEEDQEKGMEKEEVVDIIRDADKAYLIQGENTEETGVMNEEELTEKDKVGPQVAVLEVEDINTDVEKIIAEENRAETLTSVVELVEAQDNETSEEFLEPKNQPDVAGTSNEEGESVEKGKAGIEQVALSGNVVGGIEETEERNENMETQEDAVDENEAGVPGLSVTQKEHRENVLEEEAMEDISIVQESIFEKEQKLEVQKQSHDVDDEAKSDNRTELTEEVASDEASSSCLIRKHDGQRSGDETPLRRSQRSKDQAPDDELTRRVLRSGTKSVTTLSKQRLVQHSKTVRQQEVSKHMVAEPEVEQTEDIMETHTDVEGEKMETVIIPSVVDDENVKGDVEERSSMEKEHLEPKTSGGHDLEEVESKMEDGSQTKKKVDVEQERAVDVFLEVAETIGDDKKIVAIDFDTVKDAELEVEGEGTLQSVEEPAEEQEKNRTTTEMAQNSQVEQTEKEQTAEMVTSDDQKKVQEVQENITSETVQESLLEEETPVVTSRSLRRRTITVMSPLPSKPKCLQKTEVEMAGNERVVVVETVDNVDRVSTKEPEESKDEKIETGDSAVSNDEDSNPKSADTDQGRMEVVLEEQSLKETKTPQEIPGNTEMEIKAISESSREDEEDKPDNRTEPTMEDKDSDKADQSSLTKKHAEPTEKQEEEPSTEMAQNSQVEPTEKEQTAEMVKSDDQKEVQEVQENITSGCVETVQESLPEEETPVITSRSLRRRKITVMSPLPSKPKRLRKTEMEMAGNERVVVVDTVDSIDRVSTKEPEESKDEKIETGDSAVSNNEEGVPKSADTDQGRMEVVLEEQSLKETKTPQEIPGNTEMEMKEVSEPSHENEEDISDNRTEPTMEDEDSDKADQSSSTKKHAEPTEEQEEEPSTEMAQNSQVEPTEKEQTDSEQLVEIGDSENTVKIKDKTETRENLNDAVSKDEDTVPESTDSDQVMQEEEPLKVQGNEELEMKDISKPSREDKNDKSDKWTEPTEEDKDSDKADQSSSTRKHVDSRRSNYATPLRHSGRLKDQPVEGELTERVLRSGKKSVTTISKQKHVRHTKTASQLEEGAQTVGEPEVEQEKAGLESHTGEAKGEKTNTVSMSSVEEDSKMEKQHLEAETTDDRDLTEVENKIGAGSQNETTGDGREIAVMVLDDTEVVKDAEKQADETTTLQSGEEQEKEPATEVAEKEDGQNVVESTSYTAVPKQTCDTKTTEEYSLEEQVMEADADEMQKTDSKPEESMLAEENLKDDGVEEITVEEQSTTALADNTAEMVTSDDSEQHQKEVQENITSGCVEIIQESLPEEETPVITSRSLRRRTITVMSPLPSKPKRHRKTEVEMAGNEHVVVVETMDNVDRVSTKEPEESKDEKIETGDSAVSNDEDSVPKSADTDKGRMEVVLEEQPLKETKTPQEIPGNTEMVMKEVSEPSHEDEEDKPDNRTEPTMEDTDSDKADQSSITKKHADSRRSNYATPLRRSGRLKDQPVEGELTERVLRSGTKSITTISKQKHVQHTKTVSQLEEGAQAVGEQMEEVMESYTEAATEGKMNTESIGSAEDNETLKDSVEEKTKMELVKDAEREVKGKTTQEPVGESIEKPVVEPGTGVVEESTSVSILEKVAAVLVDFNKVQTSDTETTEATSQSLEEADQELDKPASTEEDREEKKEESEEVKQAESLDEPVEKAKTGWSETPTKTLSQNEALALEMREEELMTEEQVVDKMLKTDTEQEESMLTDEKMKDDRAGEITLEEKSSAAEAESMVEVHTSESEKHQKEVQHSTTSGHVETVQESSPEEETPVITSRSLRRRTIIVMSPLQQKPKRLRKTEVEISENENVIVTVVTEKIHTSSIEKKEENKAEVSIASNDDSVSESAAINQGQMEVVQEAEHVKETSVPQKIPGIELQSEVLVLSESSHADEVVNDAVIEVEGKVREQLISEAVKEQVEKPTKEMIPGQGEQKGEEATSSLKLQKASVVLVDFNKESHKLTTGSGTAKETLQPPEEVCQEVEEPADISLDIEESKVDDKGMKLKKGHIESTEIEQAAENVVVIAERENVVMDDVQNKAAEGISEIRDDDELMETEEDGVKAVLELVQEKEPIKETSALQEVPCDTQEPTQADEEESQSPQEEFSDKAHVEDERKQADNERSEAGTPGRRSRRLSDQPAVSELTTRVLRSCTKQAKATPKQQHTRQTKAMVHKEDQTVDNAGEKLEEIRKLETDVAEGEKMETVTTGGLTEHLVTAVGESVEENNELETEKIEAVKDSITEKDKGAAEDDAKATTDKEKISDHDVGDVTNAAEMRVERKTAAQPEPVEEQAPVSEIAQNENVQNAVEPTSALTLQEATVVLVDISKVQTGDSETTEGTSQGDKQTNVVEDRKESDKESTEKEQTAENEPRDEEDLNRADVLEETKPVPEMEVEEPMAEILEESVVDMGVDNSLKPGSEHVELVLTEGNLKDDQVGDITLEGEATSTVSEKMTAVCIDENQQEDQENIAPGQEKTVQESSPEEETPVVTSRSLRRRTVTVVSTPQKKTKCIQKLKAEVDKVTDVNEAERTSLICLYSEVSVPEKDEDTSNGGKVTTETEKEECVLVEQEKEALITKEIPKERNAVMEESEAKEKGEVAPGTDVSADVEATTKEEEKLSQVKSTEVDFENDENMDGEMILLVQGNTAQEKEIPAGGPANVVVEATSQAEGMVEGEVDSTKKESRQKTGVTKPAYETTEEEEPIITRNLRRRTVTVKTPMQRKSKRICQEAAEMPTATPQPEKEAPLGEASNQSETVELITAVEDKNERSITETNSKDKSEDSQVAFEGASKEVVTVGEQEGTSTAEREGEKVEKITDGEKDMVERVPEDKVEERTTEDANNEKVAANIPVESKDFRDNDLEEEPDKEEEGSAKPEQEDDQPGNVLDKLEEQIVEEKSEGEFGVVVEEKVSITEINLDELEEGVEVERRSLRKRTIKTTSGRKSKRLRKQDQDEAHVSIAEDALPVEEPADVKSLAEKVTGQEEEEITDNSEKDGQLSEEVCGERNKSTEKEKDGHELISMSETGTQLEALEDKKGEEEEEDKAEADEYEEAVREQESKSTDEVNRTVDTVEEIKESQQEAEPNERDGLECSEISHTIDESFTLELDEEEENNGPQENQGVEEMEASIMECPNKASTAIHKTDKHEEHATEKEEEPAVKKSPVLRGRSSAETSPEQRSTRQSRRFLQESPSEREVTDEQKEITKSQQKRKAIVDSTPRRSKRLARPKIV